MKQIIVKCDECLRQVNENFIPLVINATIGEVLLETHFCSYDCMKTYLLRKFEQQD